MNTQKINSLGRNMPQTWKRFLRIVAHSFQHKIFPHLWAYYVNDGRSFYPRRIILEVTYQCNLRCKMCLLYRAGHLIKRDDELSMGEIMDLIDTVKRWRPTIFLSGGEPFMRRDIMEIIASTKKENLACNLLTNGTLMNENDCLQLVELGLEGISFSINEIDTIHASKAINTIACLNRVKKEKKSKVPDIFINCVITKDNIQSLEKMVDAAGDLEVALQYQHVMFLEREAIHQHKMAISKDFSDKNDEFLEGFAHGQGKLNSHLLVEKIKEVRHKSKKLKQAVIFLPDLNGREVMNYYSMSDWWYSSWCFFPWLSLTISPYGDVYPCLQLKMGNIRDKSLAEIWNGELFRQFRNKIKRNLYPRCRRCCYLGNI